MQCDIFIDVCLCNRNKLLLFCLCIVTFLQAGRPPQPQLMWKTTAPALCYLCSLCTYVSRGKRHKGELPIKTQNKVYYSKCRIIYIPDQFTIIDLGGALTKSGDTLLSGQTPKHHIVMLRRLAGQQCIVIYNLKNINIATASAIISTSACLARFASLIYFFVSH